ncbi:MAG TPA: hypothetical protein PKY30_24890, partial [Myxococcota bacterium]|nr:hypothetical protein [Myxococcota bacterium]
FFVNVGARVYFVEPAAGASTVEVDDVGELDEEEGVTIAPAMQALASRRGGTSASASIGSTLTDEQVTTYSLYLNGAHYSSAQDAMSAIVAADETWISVGASEAIVAPVGQYRFSNFYHPLVCRFTKEVRRKGVFGLLDPEPNGTAADLVRQAVQTDFDFEAEHSPTIRVSLPYPVEDVDFSEGGAYSQYNWEIFFHLPFYIGSRLADAGQFDDAVDWLHCVFDPRTRVDANAGSDALEKLRWWKLKPFMAASSAPVTDWLAFSGADGDTADRDVFERQVAAWRKDPFNPHLIARMRAGTYQKAFVMRYLDTLIGWGDQLFTRDTIETINEATQLYVFARKVLGDRPEQLGPAQAPTPQNYLELEPTLDGFGNA